MKEWQWNVLFCVGVGGAIFLLFAPEFGFKSASNPTAVTGIGAILTYVLTQRRVWTKKKPPAIEPKNDDKSYKNPPVNEPKEGEKDAD